MNVPLDFYFEFASPYGYLASTQIEALAARHGRTVAWHPIMLGAAFKATGARPLMQTPLKGPYLLHDVPRFARLLGRAADAAAGDADELARRQPRLRVGRGGGRRAGQAPRAKALFHAHWGEGRDLARAGGGRGGRARARDRRATALLAAVADPRIKDRLKEQTQAAIERGVFGSPFIFVDGEPFWGADRLPQVDAWLRRDGW